MFHSYAGNTKKNNMKIIAAIMHYYFLAVRIKYQSSDNFSIIKMENKISI